MTLPPHELYPYNYDTCPNCGKPKKKSGKFCKTCSNIHRRKPRPVIEQPVDTPYRLIPLTRGLVTIVDVEDYVRFSSYDWYAAWSQGMHSFYASRSVYDQPTQQSTTLFLHREILRLTPSDKCHVDHANHDTLDNRKFVDGQPQLRIASPGQNMWNRIRPQHNSSGFKGVHLDKRSNKWIARLTRNGKRVYLGRFDTAQEAHAVCIAFVTAHDGEFAYIT